MHKSYKFDQLAAAYQHLAWGYAVGAVEMQAYGAIANLYRTEQSIPAVQRKLFSFVRRCEEERYTVSPGALKYLRLEEEIRCYKQALIDIQVGHVYIPARWVYFHEGMA